MMPNWENMEYLTDTELECLIRETELDGVVPAAPDLQDLILKALEQEKVKEFKRYRLRVLTTVAAAVTVVFLLPRLEGLQITELDFLKSMGKQEYVILNRYETKEEALSDSGMLEEVLGGVNIFADNSRFDLFRK